MSKQAIRNNMLSVEDVLKEIDNEIVNNTPPETEEQKGYVQGLKKARMLITYSNVRHRLDEWNIIYKDTEFKEFRHTDGCGYDD